MSHEKQIPENRIPQTETDNDFDDDSLSGRAFLAMLAGGLAITAIGVGAKSAVDHNREESERQSAAIEKPLAAAAQRDGLRLIGVDRVNEQVADVKTADVWLDIDNSCHLEITVQYVSDAHNTPTDITGYTYFTPSLDASIDFTSEEDLKAHVGPYPCVVLQDLPHEGSSR